MKLLLNLIVFSCGFAFFAPRYAERISFSLAIRWASAGAILLLLAGAFGYADGNSFEKTFLELDRGNDNRMGVILGVGAIYIALLCCLWSASRLLEKKSAKKKLLGRKPVTAKSRL